MRSLQDVVDFFVKQAGPGTVPMRTNDLRKIGLNMTSSGFKPGKFNTFSIEDKNSKLKF